MLQGWGSRRRKGVLQGGFLGEAPEGRIQEELPGLWLQKGGSRGSLHGGGGWGEGAVASVLPDGASRRKSKEGQVPEGESAWWRVGRGGGGEKEEPMPRAHGSQVGVPPSGVVQGLVWAGLYCKFMKFALIWPRWPFSWPDSGRLWRILLPKCGRVRSPNAPHEEVSLNAPHEEGSPYTGGAARKPARADSQGALPREPFQGIPSEGSLRREGREPLPGSPRKGEKGAPPREPSQGREGSPSQGALPSDPFRGIPPQGEKGARPPQGEKGALPREPSQGREGSPSQGALRREPSEGPFELLRIRKAPSRIFCAMNLCNRFCCCLLCVHEEM